MVKFGGITTGKTVDSSGKTAVLPLNSSVISVDNSGNTTGFHWKLVVTPLIIHWYITDVPLVYHRYNTTKFYR